MIPRTLQSRWRPSCKASDCVWVWGKAAQPLGSGASFRPSLRGEETGRDGEVVGWPATVTAMIARVELLLLLLLLLLLPLHAATFRSAQIRPKHFRPRTDDVYDLYDRFPLQFMI